MIRRIRGIVASSVVLSVSLLLAPSLARAELFGSFAELIQFKDKAKKDKVVPKKEVQPAFPATLDILTAQAKSITSSVVLHQVKYTGAPVFGRPVTGTADLTLTLVGQALPPLKNQKFTATVHDKSGKVSDAQITLGEDLAATHFLGGKLDLILEKGSQIVAGTARKDGVPSYYFKGSVRLRLPYATQSGKPVEVELGKGTGRKPVEIPLSAASFAISEQNLLIPPSTLVVDGFKFQGVQAIGTVRLQAHPKESNPYSLDVSLGKTKIIAYLPRFLLKQGVIVYANKVDLDQSSSTFSAANTSEAQKLECIRPAGFELQCKGGVSIKVVKGEYTDVHVEGVLQLPSCFVNCPEGIQADFWESKVPVKVAADLTYSTKGRPHWTTAGSSGFTLAWNRFGIEVKDGSQYALFFDGPGGLKVTGGRFFAGAFTTKTGTPLPISLKNPDEFFLESQGAAGQITLTTESLKGMVFPGTFDPMVFTDAIRTLHFGQGQLTKIEHFRGNFGFKDIVGLPPAITITVSPTGEDSNSFDAKALAGANVSFPDYGVRFHITQGSFNEILVSKGWSGIPPQQVFAKERALRLSGTITLVTALPELNSVALPVNNIVINSKGLFGDETKPKARFSLGQIDVDMKSFTLIITSVDLPNTGQKSPHVSVNGHIRLPGDFPLIPYDPGMRIGPGGQFLIPKIKGKNDSEEGKDDSEEMVSFLTVNDPAVPDFGEIKIHKDIGCGVLDVSLFKGKREFGGETVDCLFGTGKLSASGDSTGISGGMTMFVAKGSWLVFGAVDLPPAALIPVGNTSLKLYGFRGGLGHNINVKANVITSGTKAGDLKIDDFVYAQGNILFQAGVGITTSDNFLVWGDALITVTTAPLTFNLGLFGNLAEDRTPNPSGDRIATATLTITGSAVDSKLLVDINVPSRGFPLAAISGTSTLHIDDSMQFLHTVGRVRLVGGLLSLDGGLDIDTTTKPSITASAKATFILRQNFLGIVEGEIDGHLAGGVKDSVSLSGGVHISGDVDFGPFSASAEAWLQGSITAGTDRLQLSVDGGIQGCVDLWVYDGCLTIPFHATWTQKW